MKTIVRFAVFAGLLAAPLAARAANYTNTAAGGYWDVAGSWTLGSGTPGSGDTIALTGAGNITVTNNQQFGATSGSSVSSWNKSAPAPMLILTNGAVLTHNANDTFTVGANSTAYSLLGSGGGERFLNLGTMVQKTMWGGTLNLTNGVTLENRGLYKFEDIVGNVTIDGTSTFLINDGTIQAGDLAAIGARQPGATMTTHDGTTLKSMNLVLTGGGANKGLTIGAWSQLDNFTLAGQVKIASLSIASDTALAWANVDMTVAFPATVSVDGGMRIGKALYPDDTYGLGKLTLGNSTTWNFGKGVLAWGGIIDTAGHTLTLRGTNTFAIGGVNGFPSSTRLVAGASGGVVNQGLLDVGPTTGTDYYGLTVSNTVSGVALVNEGTMRLRAMGSGGFGGDALSIAANTTFSNAPGGLFIGAATSRGWYRAGVVGANASTSVFDNQGTVQALTNTLYFYDNVKIAQISGTSLNGGTWKASTGLPGIFDSAALRLPGANLVTIGANAAVYLENGGVINTIGTALTTINGRFIVNAGSFTTGGSGLSVGATGTIGGSGTINGSVFVNGGTVTPGNSPGTLTVTNDFTLADSSLYVWEIGPTGYDTIAVGDLLTIGGGTKTLQLVDLGGSLWTNQSVTLFTFGSLADAGNATNNWQYEFVGSRWTNVNAQVFVQGNALMLTGVGLIPEPSTLLLLAVGGWVLRRKIRGPVRKTGEISPNRKM